jgi:hypothetical protein
MGFKHTHNFVKAIIISFTVVLALITYSFPIYATDGTTVVSISTPVQPVEPGEEFQISIIIQPDNAIAGAQFSLSFNPSLVTVSSVSEGNLLKQNGASTYFNPGQIDNTTGVITGVTGAIIDPGQTVSTGGTFAVITMTAGLPNTTCPLTLSNVILGDLQAQSVLIDVVPGNITIGNHANQPPVLGTIGNKTISAGSLLTFTIFATDTDSDFLTFSAANLPSGAIFDASSHIFSWTPAENQVGNYSGVQFEITDGFLSASEKVTISVSAAPVPVSTGTGGGGSGKGSAAGGSTTIPETANNIINEDGVFIRTAELKSEDGTAKVLIAQGTKDITQDGTLINQITITTTQPPANPPEQSNIIGNIFDIGPDGVAFDRPVELTFTYDSSILPEGFDENSLFVATWDTAHGSWLGMESAVNIDNNTITANINHFSIYCVLAHWRPADFVINDLIVPAGVKVNDSVNIDALITNTGNLKGTQEVILKVDWRDAGIQQVSLPGGGSQRIRFTLTPDSAGTHVLNIGNLSANLMVEEPGNSALATSETNLVPTGLQTKDNISLPTANVLPAPGIKVFSLAILVEIMGGAFLLIAITMSLILLRRRQLINECKD